MLIDSLDLKGHVSEVCFISSHMLRKSIEVFGKSNRPKVENKLFPINSKLRIQEAQKYECFWFGSQ